jgi:dephospho-CoA kinase
MTIIIGITGGIGSGKSTLSNYLKKLNYPVHESDKTVSNMYKNPSKDFIKFIYSMGLGDVIKNKKINKKLIADKIFTNLSLKKEFEKYIHMQVGLQRQQFIKKNQRNKSKVIFIDIPLLLERNLDLFFDIILCVLATRKNRITRVLKKRKFTKKTLNQIIKYQTTDKERRSRSNIIITNNKGKKDFIFNVKKALTSFLK